MREFDGKLVSSVPVNSFTVTQSPPIKFTSYLRKTNMFKIYLNTYETHWRHFGLHYFFIFYLYLFICSRPHKRLFSAPETRHFEGVQTRGARSVHVCIYIYIFINEYVYTYAHPPFETRRGTSSPGETRATSSSFLRPAKWLHFYKSPHRVLIIPSKTFRSRAAEQLHCRRPTSRVHYTHIDDVHCVVPATNNVVLYRVVRVYCWRKDNINV